MIKSALKSAWPYILSLPFPDLLNECLTMHVCLYVLHEVQYRIV